MAACPPSKTLSAKKATPRAITAVIDKPAAKKAPTTAKKPRYTIHIDERIAGSSMTLEALECRALGHAWQRIPMAAARRLELLQRGETETVRICPRCRSRRTDIYELPTFNTLYSKIDYSDGYLISKTYQGSGRLPRQEAIKAAVVAEVPELLAVTGA